MAAISSAVTISSISLPTDQPTTSGSLAPRQNLARQFIAEMLPDGWVENVGVAYQVRHAGTAQYGQ